ncbi:MerR family transcriptional regulator [Paenibacillus segetis]|uniref:MerR family transcriptional regulator n=1 Tax=Paenibacillus segetis TaxID=1325360 RepID=A0ABQ1Y3I4_9BACL|nr:MerR family transcriptional regulator [Paenibacillus segetis]GGH10367.1 MerR family transcriptional regulator [Paenibacillus segetis]
MLYTVKEVSTLSNVTIKTLHHYHKIGLLLPSEISEAGYRLYGTKELERLQQILLYRELDFSLEQIKQLLEGAPERLAILSQQEELLIIRKQRLETIIQTLGKSIACTEKGETMDNKDMFKGFESDKDWNEALKGQNQYLKETYDINSFEVQQADVQDINEQAAEAVAFMNEMANSLRAGLRHDNEKIVNLIRDHLIFLNEHGHSISAVDFAAQNKFFLSDDFHLSMLEGQQTGLAYYLSAAAEAFAIENK